MEQQEQPKDTAPQEGDQSQPSTDSSLGNIDGGELVQEDTSVPQQSSKNMVIIAVLAVIVLVLALMYVWGAQFNTEEPPMPPAPPAFDTSVTPEAMQQAQLNESDDVAAIEADLDTTELDALDSELEAMEAELDAALAE